jgi:hypothetical protein
MESSHPCAKFGVFLFSAARPSSNVRLPAYQTTGSCFVKITPYFAVEIGSTFTEESTETTVALQSLAIIAYAFAYNSKTVACLFEGVSPL